MEMLIEYSARLIPGVALILIMYSVLPRYERVLKIILLILGFILMRDTMTPLGFWSFGVTGNVLWLRFIDDPSLLFMLGFFSLFLTLGIYFLDSSLADYVKWFSKPSKIQSIFVGIFASFLVALPFALPYLFVPIEQRGGEVSTRSLLALFLFCIFGNFLEEVLFRGYLQGYLKNVMGKNRSVVLSGLFFSVGHIFLATTVTDLGMWLLVFTFYEGLMCAMIHERYGVISATLTHGLTIFILASGVI